MSKTIGYAKEVQKCDVQECIELLQKCTYPGQEDNRTTRDGVGSIPQDLVGAFHQPGAATYHLEFVKLDTRSKQRNSTSKYDRHHEDLYILL